MLPARVRATKTALDGITSVVTVILRVSEKHVEHEAKQVGSKRSLALLVCQSAIKARYAKTFGV